MSTSHRARLRSGLATTAVVPLVITGLATASPAASDTGPAPQAVAQASAAELAAAMASPSVTVTGARFQAQPDPATAGVSDTPLPGFPTDGGTFAILSTGDVADVPVPGSWATTDYSDPPGVRGDEYDTTILEVDLDVPTGANCLAVDARFLSEDHWILYPHDAFVAELDDSTWTSPSLEVPPYLVEVLAPDNFADKPEELELPGGPITAHPWAELGFSPENGAGTAFDGGANLGMATDVLVAQTPITAGEHTVYFSIFDTGGDDSAVFLDNLRLGQVGDPLVDCAPGARPLTHQVELTPAPGSAQTATDHTVTAAVTDADGAAAGAGTPVEFTVTGANPTTGTVATAADGTAALTYAGATAGSDEVRACVRPVAGLPCSALGIATVTWTETPPPGAERFSGSDRYGTAAAVSGAWAPGVDLVYVTSGLDFPDAVPAGALGGLHDAPVLLTRPDRIPDATAAALTRLLPQRIVVIGGESAVSEPVVAELRGYAQADTTEEVSRVAGADRYATAAAAAAGYPVGVDVAYVASGAAFPDSVTGSARAGAEGGPVLLTRAGSLPAPTVAALTALQPGRIVVLGGPAAVHDTVLTDLAGLTTGTVTRLAGADRYATAAAVAGDHAPGVAAVFVASGAGYADSLSGAPWAASFGAPVLLTRPGSLPDATVAELERLDPARIIVLGGDQSVSEEVRQALATYLD